MLKRFIYFIPPSSLLVFLLNYFIEDIGQRFWCLFILGLFFLGITWAIKEIKDIITGLITSAMASIAVALSVNSGEIILSKSYTYEVDLIVVLLKWILPILLYSVGASIPWEIYGDYNSH